MPTNRVGFQERIVLFGLLLGLLGASVALFISQLVAPQPILVAGLLLDRLSAAIALLVASVGTVVFRFSVRYLDGEPHQQAFLRWLTGTVFAAYTMMIATNLILLFTAWLLTSIGLHQLLTFYQHRPQAHRPARKKFLISRLGDVALLAAFGLIWSQWQTLDLHIFLDRLNQPTAWGGAATAVALLITVAALTKSAQFPFHSWLPETMEAPTPVSALMHAGIINAGGVLLLRFAPLLVSVPLALFNLALVGTLTVLIGMLAMWAQTNVKRSLAWSTVSQMGFMMIQIGLAAFPVAVLHIIGHGFYKAWAFLRTGGVPAPAPKPATLAPTAALLLLVIGTLVALPAMYLAALLTGFDPFQLPGKLALSAIVALGMGHVWVAFFRARPHATVIQPALGALLSTAIGTLIAFGLYQGAEIYLAPVYGALPIAATPLSYAAALLPVLAVLGLSLINIMLPQISSTAAGRSFYLHALHGFYIGAYADKLVEAVWRDQPAPQEASVKVRRTAV